MQHNTVVPNYQRETRGLRIEFSPGILAGSYGLLEHIVERKVANPSQPSAKLSPGTRSLTQS
jgi:hypothetical protein